MKHGWLRSLLKGGSGKRWSQIPAVANNIESRRQFCDYLFVLSWIYMCMNTCVCVCMCMSLYECVSVYMYLCECVCMCLTVCVSDRGSQMGCLVPGISFPWGPSPATFSSCRDVFVNLRKKSGKGRFPLSSPLILHAQARINLGKPWEERVILTLKICWLKLVWGIRLPA